MGELAVSLVGEPMAAVTVVTFSMGEYWLLSSATASFSPTPLLAGQAFLAWIQRVIFCRWASRIRKATSSVAAPPTNEQMASTSQDGKAADGKETGRTSSSRQED